MSDKLSKKKDQAISVIFVGALIAALGALIAFGFGAMMIVIGVFIVAIGFPDAIE
jgi:hypothetical protein